MAKKNKKPVETRGEKPANKVPAADDPFAIPHEASSLRSAAPQGTVPMRELPQVRNTDPDTSKRAAADNLPRRGTQRFRILEYIRDNGPSLADNWEEAFVWRSGPRASELKRMGLIQPSGKTGITRFGSEAEELELTDAGRAFLESQPEE